VPSNGGARSILGDQNMLQILRGNLRERGSLFTHRQEKIGHILRFAQASAVEVVASAERHHAALAYKAVEFELAEGQGPNLGEEGLLFGLIEQRSRETLW
jgi:hypothetical protein